MDVGRWNTARGRARKEREREDHIRSAITKQAGGLQARINGPEDTSRSLEAASERDKLENPGDGSRKNFESENQPGDRLSTPETNQEEVRESTETATGKSRNNNKKER